MLRSNRNTVKCNKDTWNSNNYRYDSSTYDPDMIDSSSAAQIYEAFLNVCALGSRTSGTVGGLGHVTNSANVANVSLDGMNNSCKCLGNLNSSMDTLIGTMTKVVNATYASEQSAGGLYINGDGSEADFASYLKDFALNHSDEIFNMGGTNAFNLNEFGNYADSTTAAEGMPHYEGKITDENGNITEDYRKYVESYFYKPDGTSLYPNTTIEDLKINPANGNVQVTLKTQEFNNNSVTLTVTCNMTNPNSLANAYVAIPGTGGGGTYGRQSFSTFINQTANESDSKYTIATYNSTATYHEVADKTVADILANITGEKNNVDKAVVSGSSAGGTMTINVVRELKDVVDKPIDIMLIDAASPDDAGCAQFAKTLLREENKDVLEYLQQGSVIIAYESIRGNGGPSNANKALQSLADKDLKVVMCVNKNYADHTDPECQVFAGEVDRVMSGFKDTGSSGVVQLSSGPKQNPNDYVATHVDTLSPMHATMIQNGYVDNQYGIFVKDGNGVAVGSTIPNPNTVEEVAALFGNNSNVTLI